VAQGLLESLRNASFITGDAVVGTHGLRTLRKTLEGYAKDLRESDDKAAERKRYNQKVKALAAAAENKSSNRVAARVERNDRKLQRTSEVADAAHERALDALRNCAKRRELLHYLADSVVTATAEALSSIGAVHMTAASPGETGSVAHTSFDEDLPHEGSRDHQEVASCQQLPPSISQPSRIAGNDVLVQCGLGPLSACSERSQGLSRGNDTLVQCDLGPLNPCSERSQGLSRGNDTLVQGDLGPLNPCSERSQCLSRFKLKAPVLPDDCNPFDEAPLSARSVASQGHSWVSLKAPQALLPDRGNPFDEAPLSARSERSAVASQAHCRFGLNAPQAPLQLDHGNPFDEAPLSARSERSMVASPCQGRVNLKAPLLFDDGNPFDNCNSQTCYEGSHGNPFDQNASETFIGSGNHIGNPFEQNNFGSGKQLVNPFEREVFHKR